MDEKSIFEKIDSEQFYLTINHFESIDKLYDFINTKPCTIYSLGFNLIIIKKENNKKRLKKKKCYEEKGGRPRPPG